MADETTVAPLSTEEATKRDFDPNVGGGVDRDKLSAGDFVFSDERKFPVVTPGDVSDAVSSWGRYKGKHTFEEFKRRLKALCARKGAAFVAALPEEWKKETNKAVKIVDETDAMFTVGGYGIVWGDPEHKDLTGDYFTPRTDFWFDRLTEHPMALYHHAMDSEVKATVLGHISTKTADDIGLWVEAQINKAEAYAQGIRQLVNQGLLGFSSGSVPHLVQKEADGEIRSWPIVEFSLTPTPAEPRTLGVSELKSYLEFEPSIKAVLPQEQQPAQVKEKEITKMTEPVNLSPEQIAEMASQAALKAVEAWAKSLPAEQRGFYATEPATPTYRFADFLRAVGQGDHEALKAMGAVKDLSEQTGETGGYLVPEPMLLTLRQIATEGAVIRGNGAQVQPMTSRSFKQPVLYFGGTTANQPHTLAGVVMKWTEEGGAKQETEPEFRQMELIAHELSGYTQVTEAVAADSGIALETLLYRLFGESLRWFEDWAFIRGDGVGKPLGILNAGALLPVSREVASEFCLRDAANMLAKLMPSSMGRAIWLMHQTLIPQLVQLKDASNAIVWIPNARERMPMTLFGIPVVFTEKVPSLGTKGDVMLLDLSYYVIGERQGIAIRASEHYAFINNLMTYRVSERVDGQPWISTYLTLADGSTTVSPFVCLDSTVS